MMNEEEIQVLIDKSKKQDMTAFALLVTEYRQLVFRLAFRLLCNEEVYPGIPFLNLAL